MSMFGNYEKDELYENINKFLEDHKPSELMHILEYCMEKYQYKVEDEKKEIIEKANIEKKEIATSHLEKMTKDELIDLLFQSSCKKSEER